MARIRVTLQWIKILDKMEPFFKETGEFRFSSKISTDNAGGFSSETRFPEEGHYSLSDKPGWNFVTLNKVLFEGEVEDHLIVELMGEEIDLMSANDQLDKYERVHQGPVDDWIGLYEPADEGSDDPEAMSNWRISYIIEKS
jgi:hypothetical protein